MLPRANAGLKILLVDDDPLVSRAMQKLLQWEGYQARVVANGWDALDLLHIGFRPALIVLRLTEQAMSGLTLRRQAEGWTLEDEGGTTPWLTSIPLVMVSAKVDTTAPAPCQVANPVEARALLDEVQNRCRTEN